MSNQPAATSSTASTKFKIEQRVPSGTVKKGPYAVERSVDYPNEVVIKRRFGEGSKPLFQRDDIAINRGVSTAAPPISTNDAHKRHIGGSSGSNSIPNAKGAHRRARQSSTDSSSPERYRSRGAAHAKHSSSSQLQPSRRAAAYATTAPTTTATVTLPAKRRTPEKVPYFLDQKREKDRLRRIYGSGGSIAETDPTPKQKQRRRRSYSRSRSPPASTKMKKTTTYTGSSTQADSRRSSSRSRFKGSSRAAAAHRHRSSSGEDQRPRSQRSSHHNSSRSSQHVSAGAPATNRTRRRGSRSTSRSRSRSRERRKRNTRGREHSGEGGRNRDHDQLAAPLPPATQYIPIPVPVAADYPYAFPTWPPPPHSWGAVAAPPRFASYPHAHHMASMMPAAAMLRPPLPYGLLPPPRMFRPRYPPQHSQYGRPARGFYRPRNI